jgi:hypothetical protein
MSKKKTIFSIQLSWGGYGPQGSQLASLKLASRKSWNQTYHVPGTRCCTGPKEKARARVRRPWEDLCFTYAQEVSVNRKIGMIWSIMDHIQPSWSYIVLCSHYCLVDAIIQSWPRRRYRILRECRDNYGCSEWRKSAWHPVYLSQHWELSIAEWDSRN